MASNRPAICTTKTDLMPHLKEECTAEEVPSTVQSAAVQTFLGMAWQIMCVSYPTFCAAGGAEGQAG